MSYVADSGQWVVFGGERSCTLTCSTDMKEIAGFDSGTHKEFIPMQSSWKMQFNGFLLADVDIMAMYSKRQAITVRMTYGRRHLSGRAYISNLTDTATLHELAQVSFELTGTGPLLPV